MVLAPVLVSHAALVDAQRFAVHEGQDRWDFDHAAAAEAVARAVNEARFDGATVHATARRGAADTRVAALGGRVEGLVQHRVAVVEPARGQRTPSTAP